MTMTISNHPAYYSGTASLYGLVMPGLVDALGVSIGSNTAQDIRACYNISLGLLREAGLNHEHVGCRARLGDVTEIQLVRTLS